jgi:hypothetical protein
MRGTDAWEALAARLALVLTRLEAGEFLILHAGSYYVQCYQEPALLHVEALGNRPGFPPVPTDAAGEQRLRDLGWLPPEAPGENWTARMAFPASNRQARRLADRMLVTLREVYHAEDVGGLRYEAHHSQTGESRDIDFLGLTPVTAR